MSRTLYERLNSTGRDLMGGLLHLLYPAACVLCEAPAPLERPSLCDGCATRLLTDPYRTCPRCAGNVGPHVYLEDGCTHCWNENFPFEHAVRLGYYDGLLREAILRMKHAGGEMLAEILGALWAEHVELGLKALGADVVIPVPLHWWRRLKRGYNQSATLARALAARLAIPCKPGWLCRVRYTPKQTDLSPTARRQNVRDAFRTRRWARLHNKTVLLVDDVLTTGTTASEAARALRTAGAARVIVAVLARSHGGGATGATGVLPR